MVTSMTSDLLVRSWDMQLKASVGNLFIDDHYITGIYIYSMYVHMYKFTMYIQCTMYVHV